jgi:lycopene cyclase domain-containing protein
VIVPEYTIAAIIWLGGATVAAAMTGGRRWGLLDQRRTWITMLVFGAFTVVFDIILTGLPIVTYGDDLRSGIAIGPMPIEDLLYGLALALTAMTAFTAAARE